MTLGERIDTVIKAKGLKQVLVALDAGITPSSLNHIIRGKTKDPKHSVVRSIARAIGESVSALDGDPVENLLGYERTVLRRAALLMLERIPAEGTAPIDREHSGVVVDEYPVSAGVDADVYADAEELPKRQIPDDMYKRLHVRHVFRVRGESMTGAGINDGDHVFVDPSFERSRANGRIVVARYAGSETVKRLEIVDRTIRLVSENPKYRPRVVDEEADGFKLIGVVVAHLAYSLR